MSWHAFAPADSVKPLKYLSSAIFGDAVAGVANYDFDRAINGPRFHPKTTARSVIFNRVFDQILCDNRDERAIGL